MLVDTSFALKDSENKRYVVITIIKSTKVDKTLVTAINFSRDADGNNIKMIFTLTNSPLRRQPAAGRYAIITIK